MTENQKINKLRCLQLIEQKLAWGASADWSNTDFQRLSEWIYQETKVLLSASTLKRVWGRVNYEGNPSPSTLDALAAFVGYDNWRAFVIQQNKETATDTKLAYPLANKTWVRIKHTGLLIGIAGLFVFLLLAAAFFYRVNKPKPIKMLAPDDFSFHSQAVTKGIPNSVIFTYDASRAPADSTVFIQQSWDATRRHQVSKDQHQFTSVYYEPGFYTAKLLVGQQVVKEHPLLIPSDGWLALIAHNPIPVYLKKEMFFRKDRLELPAGVIEQNKVNLMPQAPVIKYFNVGHFDSVSVHDFSFSAQLKNNYQEGSGACQFSQVMLITKGAPIIIPLSIKGCVSELGLMGVDQMVSGKNADLSAFGVDFTDWVKVDCKGYKDNLRFYVNNELAYELPLLSKEIKIVGMAFVFAGTGAVKAIRLENTGGMVYQAF